MYYSGGVLKYAKDNFDSPFYIMMDDISFPILDIIKRDIDIYRSEHNNEYPAFVAGHKISRSYGNTTLQHTRTTTSSPYIFRFWWVVKSNWSTVSCV